MTIDTTHILKEKNILMYRISISCNKELEVSSFTNDEDTDWLMTYTKFWLYVFAVPNKVRSRAAPGKQHLACQKPLNVQVWQSNRSSGSHSSSRKPSLFASLPEVSTPRLTQCGRSCNYNTFGGCSTFFRISSTFQKKMIRLICFDICTELIIQILSKISRNHKTYIKTITTHVNQLCPVLVFTISIFCSDS